MGRSKTKLELMTEPVILRRRIDWTQRLNKVIRDNATRPFVWGEWDCALWAATAVEVMTDVDFAAPYRGTYSGATECAVRLRDEGPGSLYGLCVANLGEPIHAARARRGDVVYIADNMPRLGICYGPHSLFVGEFLGIEGLIMEPTLKMHHAFRVPI